MLYALFLTFVLSAFATGAKIAEAATEVDEFEAPVSAPLEPVVYRIEGPTTKPRVEFLAPPSKTAHDSRVVPAH